MRNLVWLAATSCYAAGTGGADLSRALTASTDVVVARATKASVHVEGGRASATLTLDVMRVLKGSAKTGASLSATAAGPVDPHSEYSVHDVTWQEGGFTAIWFLRGAESGYECIPAIADSGEPERVSVRIPDVAAPSHRSNDPGRAVADEIIEGLRWLGATHGKLLAPVARTVRAGDRAIEVYALSAAGAWALELSEALATLDSPATATLYRELTGESSNHLRAVGIAGLIRANEPEGPKRAAAEFLKLSGEVNLLPVAWALAAFRNTSDAAAVQAIGALASGRLGMAAMRKYGAQALRAMHTRESVAALTALLDAPEEEVRVSAVEGLCLATKVAETERYCNDAIGLAARVALWKQWKDR